MRLSNIKSSWNVRRLAQLSPSEWVWIVQHPDVLSVCFRRIEHLKIVFETNFDPHMQRTKLINKKIARYCIFCLAGRKFITGPQQCFLVWLGWLVRRVLHVSLTSDPKEILTYLGWPKLHVEFGSSHKKFDVWPRLLEVYLRIVKGDSPLQKLKGVWAQVISAMISGIVWAPNARASQVFFFSRVTIECGGDVFL